MHCFQRTATTDVQLGGVTIREGQRAELFYSSANFDETVFDRPFEFDVRRNPNPHLSFGGNGAHFCIGTKMAEPQRLRSGWINGVKDLQVSYRG